MLGRFLTTGRRTLLKIVYMYADKHVTVSDLTFTYFRSLNELRLYRLQSPNMPIERDTVNLTLIPRDSGAAYFNV